jgi:formylglycine-generating enzyme required for sulfatase activity
MKPCTAFVFVSLSLLSVPLAKADTFGVLNPFDIAFVTIGNPGNPADTTGTPNPVGKVDYSYRIGQLEISEAMINSANLNGGLGITHNNRGANKPATSISWFEAARFVNWLNTSTNHIAAYKFDGSGNFQLWQAGDVGYNPNNLYRNSQAKYFLPSADEWYKAAYYNPSGSGSYGDYPTANGFAPTAVSSGTAMNTAVFGLSSATGPADITQAGGLTPYGTMGQGGNVREWEETNFNLKTNIGSYPRGIRGGFWASSYEEPRATSRVYFSPSDALRSVGFRVASIPEPSSTLLGVLPTAGLLLRRRRLG